MYSTIVLSLTLVFSLWLTTHAQNSLFCATPRPRPRRVPGCGDFCTFRLCNTNGSIFQLPQAAFILLGAPRTALSPFICKSGNDVFDVKTGQARVFTEGVHSRDSYTPISRWRPRSLSHSFRGNAIKAFKMTYIDFYGIGRMPTKGNQWKFLHDRCMILPIRSYRTRPGPSGRVINVRGDRTACVAFRTSAPTIHAQLIWNSADDLDLGIVEPNGNIIDNFCPRSSAGKLNGDNNEGFCDTGLTQGKENIVFFPGGPIQRGSYEVFAKHSKSCTGGSTEARLQVMKNGVVVISDKIRSKRSLTSEEDQEIFTKRFTF